MIALKILEEIKQFLWEFKEWSMEPFTGDGQTLSRIKNLRRQGVNEENPMMEHLKKEWIREQEECSD